MEPGRPLAITINPTQAFVLAMLLVGLLLSMSYTRDELRLTRLAVQEAAREARMGHADLEQLHDCLCAVPLEAR